MIYILVANILELEECRQSNAINGHGIKLTILEYSNFITGRINIKAEDIPVF